MRGQAIVEFAIVTPLMLLIILGGVGVGMLVLNRIQLTFAAQEAAVWGAGHGGDCIGALEAAEQVLGHVPADSDCIADLAGVEVTLADRSVVVAPFVPLPSEVRVSARALIRDLPAVLP